MVTNIDWCFEYFEVNISEIDYDGYDFNKDRLGDVYAEMRHLNDQEPEDICFDKLVSEVDWLKDEIEDQSKHCVELEGKLDAAYHMVFNLMEDLQSRLDVDEIEDIERTQVKKQLGFKE